MLALPTPPRRAQLRAFGLIVATAAAILAALVLRLLGVPAWPFWALAGLAVSGWIFWWRPETVGGAYRLWNRGAAAIARIARFMLLAASYFVVMAAGRSKSWPEPERSGTPGSGWTPRSAAASLTFESLSHRAGNAERGWIAALGPSNRWMLALVPYFALLGRMQGRAKSSLGQDVYTLY